MGRLPVVGKCKAGAMEMEGEVKVWEMWEQLRRAWEGEGEEMADEIVRLSLMRVVMWGRLPVVKGRETGKGLETEKGRETKEGRMTEKGRETKEGLETEEGLETVKGVEMEESKDNLEDREIEGGQDGGEIQ